MRYDGGVVLGADIVIRWSVFYFGIHAVTK